MGTLIAIAIVLAIIYGGTFYYLEKLDQKQRKIIEDLEERLREK